MKKFLVALALAAALPLSALASCTYTAPDANTVKSVCTTTTEAAPTLVTEGLSLSGVRAFNVVATASSAWTAGGTLNAYIWSAQAGAWVRAPDFDLTLPATTGQAWQAVFVPVNQGSRIDYKPSVVGAVTTTIYMVAVK